MVSLNDILLVLKHIAVIGIFVCIVLTPAYLAVANGRAKNDLMRTRVGSWLFGWSGIGWIIALFIASKK